MPDGPLLLALAGAALALAKLFFDEPDPRAAWGLWLAAGVWLGLAGLSKYSAALFVVGLVAFVALSPRQRHWFAHPAPYLAALLALAMVSPVFVWNWRHGWVSLAFQGERGAMAGAWRPAQVGSDAARRDRVPDAVDFRSARRRADRRRAQGVRRTKSVCFSFASRCRRSSSSR